MSDEAPGKTLQPDAVRSWQGISVRSPLTIVGNPFIQYFPKYV